MYIETFYDGRAPVLGGTSERVIPYPELSGEELTVWQKYLPLRSSENLHSWLDREAVPDPVMREIERAKRAPRSFDRIELWSRTDDPMVVGVIGGETPQYFAIARWGDAKLTLTQIKRILWVDKWLLLLTLTGAFGFVAVKLVAHTLS